MAGSARHGRVLFRVEAHACHAMVAPRTSVGLRLIDPISGAMKVPIVLIL